MSQSSFEQLLVNTEQFLDSRCPIDILKKHYEHYILENGCMDKWECVSFVYDYVACKVLTSGNKTENLKLIKSLERLKTFEHFKENNTQAVNIIKGYLRKIK